MGLDLLNIVSESDIKLKSMVTLSGFKFLFAYRSVGNQRIIHRVSIYRDEVLEDITPKFQFYDKELGLKTDPSRTVWDEYRLNKNESSLGFLGFVLYRVTDDSISSFGKLILPSQRYEEFQKVETEIKKVVGSPLQETNPHLNAVAGALFRHQKLFVKGVRCSKKREFLKETAPDLFVPNKNAELRKLSELTDLKTTSLIYNGKKDNDYLAACAYHRWFPTRYHILPKHFERLVKSSSELQHSRVLDLWIQNYITRLEQAFTRNGKEKARNVSAALSAVRNNFNEVLEMNASPQILTNLLLYDKTEVSINDNKLSFNLIDAIAKPRTHHRRIGRVSLGFEKLLKDFPSLTESHREYLRFQVWIKRYIQSLEERTFNKNPEKARLLTIALNRANRALSHHEINESSLITLLTEPFSDKSILDLIQTKQQNSHDSTRGYRELCENFPQLQYIQLEKWILAYCKKLSKFDSIDSLV